MEIKYCRKMSEKLSFQSEKKRQQIIFSLYLPCLKKKTENLLCNCLYN